MYPLCVPLDYLTVDCHDYIRTVSPTTTRNMKERDFLVAHSDTLLGMKDTIFLINKQQSQVQEDSVSPD